MVPCPICSTVAVAQWPSTPYWTCPRCDGWFQSPMPPKVYEAAHEKAADGGFQGHLMGEHEKAVNQALAEQLFHQCLKDSPGKVLDIGSKYPYLAHCFKNLGCDAFGMDNLEIVPDFAQALGVPMLLADFEKSSNSQIQKWSREKRFQLITMVHVFEHMYDPLEALRKLRRLLADDGRLFLRLPDHKVSGFERDLTPGHFTIHPFYHCLDSLLELLVQGSDLFAVEATTGMAGSGQRDLVLRPLTRKPSVHAFLITKNEERDLPRCLRSIETVVDGVLLRDTGSTDRTLEVAVNTIAKPVQVGTYLEASRQDAAGDWKLWDFAKARNECLNRLEEQPGVDFILWMDADDELLTPEKLRRAIYLDLFSVFGVQIDGGLRWVHHRLWKAGLGIRFEGRIHEYPQIGDHPSYVFDDIVIRHDAAPGPGEGSLERNLRILLEEYGAKPTPRTAYYLADTYRGCQRWQEAAATFGERIAMGPHYRDEWLFAYLQKARCEKAAGLAREAESTLLEAVSKAPDWAEFWMELGFVAFDQGRWAEAMGYALQAGNKAPAHSLLWREPNKYLDQPPRLISFCLEQQGDLAGALAWALRARAAIQGPDAEWDARVEALTRATSGPRQVLKLALFRPGAIGDILMTLNHLPALKEKYPGRLIHYFCLRSTGEQLGPLLLQAGVDEWKDMDELPALRHEYEKVFNLVGYPLADGYPERPMKRHLLQYFADELGVASHGLPSLQVDLAPLPWLERPYATLHATAGWSAYKNWPLDRWEAVVKACPGIPVYQMGAAGDPRVPGARHDYMGAPLMMSIALLAGARMHLGVDSFSNHLTHYRWNRGQVPALILFGSTQASASGYPHNVNLSLDLACQPCFREDPALSRMARGPCVNPAEQVYAHPRHACMEGLTVERVLGEVQGLWERTGAVRVAEP